MSENTGTTTPPPWGSDDEFKPDKAWTLIQNLRAAETALKDKVRELQSAVDAKTAAEKAKADEGKSEIQKLTERLEAAEIQTKKDRRDLLIERAQRKHDLSDDALVFLTGDTAEEIEQRAAALAAFGGKKNKGSSTDDTKQKDAAQTAGRPATELRPDHGGDHSPAFDTAGHEALAADSRTRRR